MRNNTFANNYKGVYIQKDSGHQCYTDIHNNIFDNHHEGLSFYSTPVSSELQLSYNIFRNASGSASIVGYTVNPLSNPGIKYVNPQLDTNYKPIWNATVKSPCIDAGDPIMFDSDGTPSDIGCYPIFDHAIDRYKFLDQDPDKYYWIGYTLKDSSLPQVALASIWNNVIMVKTKDWCMSRVHDNIWLSASKIYPFNYGDMVVITTRNNRTFHWGAPSITNPDKKPETKHFEFPAKLDYIPVYLDLKEVNMSSLKEIGLYVNSICKGAVVVTDSLVQLNANLDIDEAITSDNVEFVFYYESKNQPQELKSIRLTNSKLNKSFIDGNAAYPYYQVSIKGSDMNAPVNAVTSLNQNFPNPFNPTTTISYNLKEDAKVALDIYNIRGQLVKSLQSGFVTKGLHSVIWEGKDTAGNSCASGVYLYKMTTNDTSITHKMMLLK